MNVHLLLLLCASCGLQACSVREPIAQFETASIVQSTPEAIALSAEFEISNTNDEPLKLERYTYTVYSKGKEVYQAERAAELTVPRWTSMKSSIPIVIRREDLGVSEQAAWNLQGSITYIPPTALAETLLQTGLWTPTTTIRAHGAFTVPRVN